MAYVATTWVEGSTKLGPTNMNHIEQGIVTADVNATAAIPAPASSASGEVAVYNGSSWVRSSVTKIATGQFAGIKNADVDAAAAIVYSKLSVAAGDIPVSKLVAGNAGQFIGGTTPAYAYPPGYEIDYVTVTSNTNVTGATAATADNIITGTTVSYDGTAVYIEMFCPQVTRGTNWLKYVLYDGSTQIGDVCAIGFSVQVGYGKVKVTPTAANHTYNFRAYVDAGTGVINAGTGAAGSLYPAFIRVTKA